MEEIFPRDLKRKFVYSKYFHIEIFIYFPIVESNRCALGRKKILSTSIFFVDFFVFWRKKKFWYVFLFLRSKKKKSPQVWSGCLFQQKSYFPTLQALFKLNQDLPHLFFCALRSYFCPRPPAPSTFFRRSCLVPAWIPTASGSGVFCLRSPCLHQRPLWISTWASNPNMRIQSVQLTTTPPTTPQLHTLVKPQPSIGISPTGSWEAVVENCSQR